MSALVEVQSLIAKYTDITSDIIKDLDSNEFPRIHPISVRYLFIKRFHYNSLAINELISNYTKDKNFKLPLFIVLRTCISDYLYLKYIGKIISDNANNIEAIEFEIKQLLVDNLKHLHKELDYLKDNKEISTEKYNLSLVSIKQMYPEFYDSKSGLPIKNNAKTFTEIYKILRQDVRYSLESKAFDLYKLYSKFEHIGALTFDLGKNYDDYSETEENSIVMSITWIVDGLELLISEIAPNIVFIDRLKESLDNLITMKRQPNIN